MLLEMGLAGKGGLAKLARTGAALLVKHVVMCSLTSLLEALDHLAALVFLVRVGLAVLALVASGKAHAGRQGRAVKSVDAHFKFSFFRSKVYLSNLNVNY